MFNYGVQNQKFPLGNFYRPSKEICTERLLFHKQETELITSLFNFPQFQAINRPVSWFCTSPWLMTLRSFAMQTMEPCRCCTEANRVIGNVLLWAVILISGNYGPTLLLKVLQWTLVVIRRVLGNSLLTLLYILNKLIFLELYFWMQTVHNSLIILFLRNMVNVTITSISLIQTWNYVISKYFAVWVSRIK